ncbi:uncharacterized protein LOC106013157 [Aplysia californica]|uniref:Uncharacterized protein LOC106013157 n=1 Tax=Aplysia californica TaxID=6500 RepID=A0ABM1A9V7_APLCA|nr:uncharacterized protein LOC106013157 [Aplysia californica]
MLPQLQVGDHVYVQNLVGNHPRKWERTGVVTEVRQFHQYVVRVGGSGRITLRNRQHLRKFTPFHKTSTVITGITPITPQSARQQKGPDLDSQVTPSPPPEKSQQETAQESFSGMTQNQLPSCRTAPTHLTQDQPHPTARLSQ